MTPITNAHEVGLALEYHGIKASVLVPHNAEADPDILAVIWERLDNEQGFGPLFEDLRKSGLRFVKPLTPGSPITVKRP